MSSSKNTNDFNGVQSMRKEFIHEGINANGQKFEVIAVWLDSGFLYTKTNIFDDEGYLDSSVTVFADGSVSSY